MKKLGKEQIAKRDELVKKLQDAQKVIDETLIAANAVIEEKLAPAITAYNELVGEVESFRDEITGEMESYFDERSEKWQEGDAGSNYTEWKDNWSNLDCTEMDAIETISIDQQDLPENLEGMDTEPSS